jgi:hypothetical protein
MTKRRRLAVGLLLLAAAVPLAAGADQGPASGLPWLSGSTSGGDCLADLRGRALDVRVNFVTHKSFQAMVNQTGQQAFKDNGVVAPLWVVSLPLLTDDTRGQFAQCAGSDLAGTDDFGGFDQSWRLIGANLASAASGKPDPTVVVRLGWEANIGRSHPWGVTSPDQIPSYIGCWRQAAARLKEGASAAPGVRLQLEWTSAKKTANTALHVLDMYPGDDVVDLWGVHYYDSGPIMNTQKRWDAAYKRTFNGGPWGLGPWLQAATAPVEQGGHGKQLAVSEWGIWQQAGQTATAADDPVYIHNMWQFFQANAGVIAYESYLNSPTGHALCPSTSYPNAAAQYQADWQPPPPAGARREARARTGAR